MTRKSQLKVKCNRPPKAKSDGGKLNTFFNWPGEKIVRDKMAIIE